jgi:hypothetical protein
MSINHGIAVISTAVFLMAAAVACEVGGGAAPTPAAPGDLDRVEVYAPVTGVEIEKVAAKPPNATLIIESGLPNGCYEFGGFRDLKKDGDRIVVEVVNLRLADKDVACAEIYKPVAVRIQLGEDIESCETYIVEVNGEEYSAVAKDQAAGCRDEEPPVTPSPTGGTGQRPVSDKVEKPAPIESVEIETISANGSRGTLIAASALPNGCHEIGGFRNLVREGDSIRVEVVNLVETGENIACTELYQPVVVRIPLGEGVQACATYIVEINGQTHRVMAIDPAVRCEGPSPVATPAPTSGGGTDGDTEQVPAPIDGVEILIAESYPPQYFVAVASGLPNGCARFDGHKVVREGDTVRVSVTNLVPRAKDVMCTQVYGTVESNIPLGTDFKPGQKYTVHVNDITETFVAQGDGGSSTAPPAGNAIDLDIPFQLEAGEAALLESQGVKIGLMEVLEDSRCPRDVVCVWAGRAVVLISVTHEGQNLAQAELAIGEAGKDASTWSFGRYTVELLALDPYPAAAGSGDNDEKPVYSATLVLSPESSGSIGTGPSTVDPAKLALRWEQVSGQPLTVSLVAEIVGGPDNSRDLFCVGSSWEFGDGLGQAAMPGCVPWSPDVKIVRHHKANHTYDRPGAYKVVFEYGPLNSRPIAVEVR